MLIRHVVHHIVMIVLSLFFVFNVQAQFVKQQK